MSTTPDTATRPQYTDEEISIAFGKVPMIAQADTLDLLRAFLAALPERTQAQPGPWPGQQEAIDKAFLKAEIPWICSYEESFNWAIHSEKRLAIAQAYDKARPQAAEIAALKAELEKVIEERDALVRHHDVSRCQNGHYFRTIASSPARSEREWECPTCAVIERNQAQAELAKWRSGATAQLISNQRDKLESAVERAEKAEADVNAELAESQRKLSYAEEHLGILAKTFGYEGRTWCNMVSYLAPRLQKAEAELAKAQAELASLREPALRQPILADDGRSLGQVAEEAYEECSIHLKEGEWWEAAAETLAAVVLAQAVRRMEAVPVEELYDAYMESPGPITVEDEVKHAKARLIAAAKGEGQAKEVPQVVHVNTTGCEPMTEKTAQAIGAMVKAAKEVGINGLTAEEEAKTASVAGLSQYVVVNEPSQGEKQPDLSGESEKQTQPALISIDDDGNPAPDSDEPSEPYHGPEAKAHQEPLPIATLARDQVDMTPAMAEAVEAVLREERQESAQLWTPAVGDTVRLKSGGPVMTVYDIAKDKSFICCVHNTKGLCDYTTLPAACLTPAQP